MPRFTVAAAQYPIDRLADWAAYKAKLTSWVEQAVAGGAALLVFPEYGAMELASLDPATMADLAGSIDTVSALLPRVDALHARLAQAHGVHILAASAPAAMAMGGCATPRACFPRRCHGHAGQADHDPVRAGGMVHHRGRGAARVRYRAGPPGDPDLL
ncbi:hypothetical protein ACFS32_07615 [Novosphingobium pokkalii]|uniref:hypothetical protein n=1 Tax=Novosphingobium pokkalii TaxID=1770194 RepID=UPI00363D2FB5